MCITFGCKYCSVNGLCIQWSTHVRFRRGSVGHLRWPGFVISGFCDNFSHYRKKFYISFHTICIIICSNVCLSLLLVDYYLWRIVIVSWQWGCLIFVIVLFLQLPNLSGIEVGRNQVISHQPMLLPLSRQPTSVMQPPAAHSSTKGLCYAAVMPQCGVIWIYIVKVETYLRCFQCCRIYVFIESVPWPLKLYICIWVSTYASYHKRM